MTHMLWQKSPKVSWFFWPTKILRRMKSEDQNTTSFKIQHHTVNLHINLRGVLNFSPKSIRRRICHVKAYAWNVNFSAFPKEELFRIKAWQWRQNALKFTFRCTKIYILTRDQYIFGQNKFKLVITCQNVIFSAWKRKF